MKIENQISHLVRKQKSSLIRTLFIPQILMKFSAKIYLLYVETMQWSIQSWNTRLSTFLTVEVFV